MIERPQAWPSIAGHLEPSLDLLRRTIVMRCYHDIMVCENPPGSNLGGRIDEYNRRAGSPKGSYWCASWATAVWVDCGADVPPRDRASCDVIWDWAEREGLLRLPAIYKPLPGDIILYGTPGKKRPDGSGKQDLSHIGIIGRDKPYILSIEGNTTIDSGFSRNGEAVQVKRPDANRTRGYVVPRYRAEMRPGGEWT